MDVSLFFQTIEPKHGNSVQAPYYFCGIILCFMRGNSTYGFIGMHSKLLTDSDIRLIRMLEYERIIKENRHILLYVPHERVSHTQAVVTAYLQYLRRVCGTCHDVLVCPLPEHKAHFIPAPGAVAFCLELAVMPSGAHAGRLGRPASITLPDPRSSGLRAPPVSP